MADYEGIPQQAVDSLLANPEKADGFDQVFGKGRAAEVLAGRDSQTEPKAKKSPQMADYEEIPQQAIDSLLADPEKASGFDQVFGKGRAEEVLASRDPQPEPKAKKSPEIGFFETIWDVSSRAVWSGTERAVNETFDAAESFDRWASTNLDSIGIPSRLQLVDKDGKEYRWSQDWWRDRKSHV